MRTCRDSGAAFQPQEPGGQQRGQFLQAVVDGHVGGLVVVHSCCKALA